jgi:hypothetical protein
MLMPEKYPFHVLRRDGFPKGKKVLSMCLPQAQPRIRADAAVPSGITRRSGTGVFESTPHKGWLSAYPAEHFTGLCPSSELMKKINILKILLYLCYGLHLRDTALCIPILNRFLG